MQRTFQRPYCRCDSRINVGLTGTSHSYCKCGIIPAAMLGMKYKSKIKEVGFKPCELCALSFHHVKKVLGSSKVLLGISNHQCFPLVSMTECLVRVCYYRRELGYNIQSLRDHIRQRYIVGIIVQNIKAQNRPGKHVQHILPFH